MQVMLACLMLLAYASCSMEGSQIVQEDGKIRGSKEANSLRYIGMPVGGIGCGTVYLGGDGRLWVWDIFNQHHEGVVANQAELPAELVERYVSQNRTSLLRERDGANYVAPPTPDGHPGGFEQGFGLEVNGRFQRFAEADWKTVEFAGNWPVGEVLYRDSATPVEVKLKAFSPFIPLNLEDSSLPLTIMEFTVSNPSGEPVTATLSGWVANPVGMHSGKSAPWELTTETVELADGKLLQHGAEPSSAGESIEDKPDFGTMALVLLDAEATASQHAAAPGWARSLVLAPGESATVVFLLTWHFPNIYPLWGFPKEHRHYRARFADAAAVADFAADNYPRLSKQTALWVETWYDSTLPGWFLDRTILTANTLQTANCFIFEDGQFWAWEGIGACEGTCTHVWQYAQSPARLFPALERNLREVTDFAYAQNPETGLIAFRGVNPVSAVDGQAGIVLRTLREHQMSADDAFLRRVWPKCKFALQGLMALDTNADGILDGAQHNTLDSDWFGEVAWLSGHYLAAVRAGEQMATEMGDLEFAQHCHALVERGSQRLVERLFDQELGYFINRIDPAHRASVNSGTGCHIDQVLGQSWAFQVGLERVLPKPETTRALRALWQHNFITDVGPWRLQNKPGRWYAVPGEAGLVMCTFPDPDWSYTNALGEDAKEAWSAMYFNECMSGFEYQVAAHMVYEGEPDLVRMGLTLTRAIHDRYHPAKRNPYNEIECSDHYARAAAGYGVFLAACGFEYHGPAKRIGFAPRLAANDFRAPFTVAEGWGTFSQQQVDQRMQAQINLRYGRLVLRTLVLKLPDGALPESAVVTLNGRALACEVGHADGRAVIRLAEDILLDPSVSLSVSL